jgi:hypothetical protein
MWLFGCSLLSPGLILIVVAVSAFSTQDSHPGDPARPLKQGHYMSAGQFALVLGLGFLFCVSGAWLIARAEALAVRIIRRRRKSAAIPVSARTHEDAAGG